MRFEDMDRFTIEEINLMCIYDISSRMALRDDLATALFDVYDPEMAAIFGSAIEKLETLSDEGFANIGFYAADDPLDEGDSTIDG